MPPSEIQSLNGRCPFQALLAAPCHMSSRIRDRSPSRLSASPQCATLWSSPFGLTLRCPGTWLDKLDKVL